MDCTEAERKWAQRVGLTGRADQAGEAIKEAAQMIAMYHRALIAEGVPKRLAAELTFAYQYLLMESTFSATNGDGE